MDRILTASMLILVLVGCATSKETYTQDGRLEHKIECTGITLTREDCLNSAGAVCGDGGYDIIAERVRARTPVRVHQRSAVDATGGEGQNSSTSEGPRARTVISRDFVVACKPPS